MPKPYAIHTTEYFRMKAKDVKKKDNIYAGGHSMRVLSNVKNSFGERVITCSHIGNKNKSVVTLILPRKLEVRVTRRTHTHPKKK